MNDPKRLKFSLKDILGFIFAPFPFLSHVFLPWLFSSHSDYLYERGHFQENLVLSWFIEWMINWWINLTFKDMFQFIIGPESDHWLCLSLTDSLTHWLTDCCLVNLIDVTLVCEDGNSKLVEVVTVVEIDHEKRVDTSLVQIWKVNFGHKVKFLSGLWG